MNEPRMSPGGRAPDSWAGATLRFLVELIAWVATPWALWGVSVPLALAAAVLLIGLPTVFATPGDKANAIVPVPGAVTIGLNLLQFLAALVSAWIAWPAIVAVVVTVLVLAAVGSQFRRWRWLLNA